MCLRLLFMHCEGEGRCTLDSTNHGTISSPLLGICQMRFGVQIGGYEQAAWVLANAQCRILDLVVIDVAVKAHNDCSHLQAAAARQALLWQSAGFPAEASMVLTALCCRNEKMLLAWLADTN